MEATASDLKAGAELLEDERGDDGGNAAAGGKREGGVREARARDVGDEERPAGRGGGRRAGGTAVARALGEVRGFFFRTGGSRRFLVFLGAFICRVF